MSVNSIGGPSQSPIPMMDSYEQVSAELGGDVDAQIAALMLVSSHEQRESLHKAREATEKRLEASENKQVQSMREQADHIEQAGLVQGLTQIGGGAAEIGGAGGMLKSKKADTGKAYLQAGSGFSDVSKGLGGVFAAGERREAGMAEADATAAGNRADANKRTLEDIRDDDKDARDTARKALDMVEQLQNTQAAMNQAALFQRV